MCKVGDVSVNELNKLAKELDDLRKNLQNLIDKKDNLSDPEVIVVSKMLDALLNKYNNLLYNKQLNNNTFMIAGFRH